MPYALGGLGFFGVGILLVVAAGTLAYSLFSEESRHQQYQREYTTPRIEYSPSFSNDHDSTTRNRKKKRNSDSEASPSSSGHNTSNPIKKKEEPNRLEGSGRCSICRKDLKIDSKVYPCQLCQEPYQLETYQTNICEQCLQKPCQLNTCQHSFHYECIFGWFEKSLNSVNGYSNCPLCKCRFEPKNIIASKKVSLERKDIIASRNGIGFASKKASLRVRN